MTYDHPFIENVRQSLPQNAGNSDSSIDNLINLNNIHRHMEFHVEGLDVSKIGPLTFSYEKGENGYDLLVGSLVNGEILPGYDAKHSMTLRQTYVNPHLFGHAHQYALQLDEASEQLKVINDERKIIDDTR